MITLDNVDAAQAADSRRALEWAALALAVLALGIVGLVL